MDLKVLVEKQRVFFNSGQTRSIDFRKNQLQKLKDIFVKNKERVMDALAKDLKKSNFEAFISEYAIIIDEINHAIKNLSQWAKPQNVSTSLSIKPASAQIIPEPFGVSLIISPWNYPFQLALLPVVGAIAAGNTVILKPSELSSHTEKALLNLVNDNFEENYFHVVSGGKEIGQELLKQKFDFIFFTGSTAVGKIVMSAAAENLTPVCLELGGKSPCIIDESANLDVAARRIVWGKFFNTGQTCVAPDYIYVHESIKSTFVGLLKKTIRQFYGENESKSNDYGRIISQNHFDRLVRMIEGSKILYGGDKSREEKYIAPTLLEVESWNENVMKEEVFGPLLPILSYNDLNEVVELIQSKDRPLALYIFSTNKNNIRKVTTELSYGGGCVNDCLLQFSSHRIPVGGVGASGLGRYHGKYSFETFSHYKSIITKSNFLDLNMRYPPYTEKKLSWIKKILKTD